jgi:hypothetical protein
MLSALFERVILQPSMRKAVQEEQSAVSAMGLKNDCVRCARLSHTSPGASTL